MKATLDEVIKLVAEWVPIGYPISGETTLEALDLDSLDRIEIVIALEDDYNVNITDDEVDAISTVNDLLTAVNRHIV